VVFRYVCIALCCCVLKVFGFNSFMRAYIKPQVVVTAGIPNKFGATQLKASRIVKPLYASVNTDSKEQFKFESNVARVMDIIINSLYSNKDVFLRELVSNAADACDKKRFSSLTSSDGSNSSSLQIKIFVNRQDNTLTIEDSGIGMNKDELVQNLGKIAESGTKRFMENADKNKKDGANLIGQFGVGFYSGFLVANKIDVITKGSSGEQLKWSASVDSLDQYTIESDHTDPPISTSGTRIILHLKDECDQYLDDAVLKTLLEKYSEFIAIPIQ
jgi:molecular chaperone HtpG